jgi:hypothetical protein
MAPSYTKLQQPTLSASPGPATNDVYRVKSVATRLTEAELSEVEVAASKAGKRFPNGCAIPLSPMSALRKRSKLTLFSWQKLWECEPSC